MDDQRTADVDAYLDGLFGSPDPLLAASLDRAEAAGLPRIQVSALHGRFLHVLALARGARSILEIGTLGGYSTIWLARALPDGGRLVSLELDASHAEVARENLVAAGLADRVEVRTGPALASLRAMADADEGPFDLVFIDADKPSYPDYLDASLPLMAPGTLLAADNVVRRGAVADGPTTDPLVEGVQRFDAAVAAHPRLTGAILQTVGAKGHDGLAFAVVRDAVSD